MVEDALFPPLYNRALVAFFTHCNTRVRNLIPSKSVTETSMVYRPDKVRSRLLLPIICMYGCTLLQSYLCDYWHSTQSVQKSNLCERAANHGGNTEDITNDARWFLNNFH